MPADATASMLEVGVFGAGDAFRRMLDMLFKLQGQGRFHLADGGALDLAIVDLDGPRPESVWREFRERFPEVPAVVLSMRETSHQAERQLRKPVRADALLSALESLRGVRPVAQPTSPVLASTPVVVEADPALVEPDTSSAPRARPLEARPLEAAATPLAPALPLPPVLEAAQPVSRNAELVAYVGEELNRKSTRDATSHIEGEEGPDSFCVSGTGEMDLDVRREAPRIPRHTLLDICIQAATEARRSGDPQFVVIHGLVEPIIFMPQDGGYVVTRLGKNRMRFICLAPLTDVLRVIVPLRGLPPDLDDCPHVPYAQFIWEVALLTSRGRLPEGTDLDTPLRLRNWPNLTRCMESPGAMRIASLWAGAAYSLAETIRTLALAPGCVYAFYFAADSLGLLERQPSSLSRRESARLGGRSAATSSNAPRPAASLLGRILKRLLA